MSYCTRNTIVNSIKGNATSYIIKDDRSEIFIPRNRFGKATLGVAQSLVNKATKLFDKGSTSLNTTYSDGIGVNIHPTQYIIDLLNVKDNEEEFNGFVNKYPQSYSIDPEANTTIDIFGDSNTNLLYQRNNDNQDTNVEEQLKKFNELQEKLSDKEFTEVTKNVFESSPELQEAIYEGKISLGDRSNPYFFSRDKDQEDYVLRDPKSFIPFENHIYYQLPQERKVEEYVASEKTIRDIAERMSDRIGVPIKYISDRTQQFKGKLENGTAVINLAYATLDTPIHEILSHPIIRVLKNKARLTAKQQLNQQIALGNMEKEC